MEKTPKELLPKEKFDKAVLSGALGGLALVAIPYFASLTVKIFLQQTIILSSLLDPTYSFSLLMILPFVQGVIAGTISGPYKTGFRKESRIAFSILAVDYLLAIVIFREGFICLLMALPIFLLIIAIGLWIGRLLSRYKNRKLHSSLIPVVMLFVAYDTSYARPDFSNAISDAVTINAPPEVVWRYIVQYPENNKAPEYWLWRIGLPMPIQSTVSEEKVGAERQCRFTGNIAFDEQITELVPNKVMTFKVTAQPNHPEIIGHFSLDKGQIYLEVNPDGTTTVIATSWYRIFVRPAAYFDWWAEDIARNVHFRVLNHMKALAEADKRAQTAMVSAGQ